MELLTLKRSVGSWGVYKIFEILVCMLNLENSVNTNHRPLQEHLVYPLQAWKRNMDRWYR
ncbi:hypothetical protein EAY22_25310 [Vibrio anguillarum]|nr:hypothetical protein [Vibrio anguillarum]